MTKKNRIVSKVLNITLDYEPIIESETRISMATGDLKSFPVDGWTGSLMIDSQCSTHHFGVMMWNIRRCKEPKDVLQAEVKLLTDMRNDIDEAIKKLTQYIEL